jgi:hypothetical protein
MQAWFSPRRMNTAVPAVFVGTSSWGGIRHCVGLYFRFCLSRRQIEELMAERDVTLTRL